MIYYLAVYVVLWVAWFLFCCLSKPAEHGITSDLVWLFAMLPPLVFTALVWALKVVL